MTELHEPHRRQPLNSVSTKIISLVFLSTFLTALVVSWISIQSTYRYLRRDIDEGFPRLLWHSAVRLESWIGAGVAELQEDCCPVGGKAAAAALRRHLKSSTHFSALALFSQKGTLIASAGRDGAALGADPGARRSGSGPGFGSFAPESERFAPWVRVSAPARSGRSRSVLVGALDVAALAEQLSPETRDSRRSLFLIDAAGRVLASTSDPAEGLEERIARSDLLEAPAGEVAELIDPGGENLLASTQGLRDLGWTLLVLEPFESAFEPVLSVVSRIFLSDLCVILLFSILAYRITTRIMHPIEALSEGAYRISQGQTDHEIPDPRSGDELGLLTRTFNDMMRKLRRNQLEIEETHARLKNQYDELLSANEILAQLSITDGLTKLHNHRYFQDHLTREIKRVSRSGEPLSMLLFDLDDFKSLNDRMGHAAGDELLVRVANIMIVSVRESDLLARYGGEEFVVLAPNTGLEGAEALAEKIRTAVADAPHILDESLRPVRVTISVGVALFRGDRRKFFQAADRALYQAKAQGKNCVMVAS